MKSSRERLTNRKAPATPSHTLHTKTKYLTWFSNVLIARWHRYLTEILPIANKDGHKTAFSTPSGFYSTSWNCWWPKFINIFGNGSDEHLACWNFIVQYRSEYTTPAHVVFRLPLSAQSLGHTKFTLIIFSVYYYIAGIFQGQKLSWIRQSGGYEQKFSPQNFGWDIQHYNTSTTIHDSFLWI